MATPSGGLSEEDRAALEREEERALLLELAEAYELRNREYSEALKLGEVLVTYGRVMMIGAGGAGKTSLRHGLMKKPLPKMAFSTLLANSLSVKYQWASACGQRWVEIDEEDEINELAALLTRTIEDNSFLQSAESASAIKKFQPFIQPQSEGLQSASSNSRDHFDIVEKIRRKVFTKAQLAKLHHQPRSEVLLNLWDSGGQLVFMNVLPAFLTKRTLFMLVFDASKNLEAKLQFEARHAGEIVHTEDYQLNTIELLLQWMASIDAHLSLRKPDVTVDPYPRVMLVGTHLDQLVRKGHNPAKVTKTILDSLHSQYKDKTYADLLMPSPGYIVDNTTAGQDKEDPAFQTIRKCVHAFATRNFTVSTPITWVLFRKVMQTISQANKPVMRYSEVITVAEACSVPTSALPSVLNFYHELGVFLYYSKIPSLREVVIATPQWLVDHIAKLLAPCGLEDHGRERLWSLFRQSGILTKILYTDILQDRVMDPQGVLDLLEYFLLAVPIETTCTHPYVGNEYFVPCMLDACSDSIPGHSPSQPSTNVRTTKPMHLIFNTRYVPPGFYVRLLASIAKHEDCNIIFEQSSRYTVTFDYQEVDEITVTERTDSIEVQVTRAAQGGPHVPPFHRICRNILGLVNTSIQEVYMWLPGVSVNTAFVCSSCSSDLPTHFVIFNLDALPTTTVRCQKKKRQQLGQLQSQQYWLNMQESNFDSCDSRPTSSQIQQSEATELPAQQQHWDQLPGIHPPPGVYSAATGEQMDALESKKGGRKRAFPETTTQLEPGNYHLIHVQGDTMQGTAKMPRTAGRTTVPKLGELIEHVAVSRWYKLGLALGVDDSRLDYIKQDTRGDSETGLTLMFREWLHSSEQPSWDNVIQALKTVGETKLAAELRQKF